MTAFTIDVQDQGIKTALKALSDRINNIEPALLTIGAGIIERAKHRFETSTAPDGTPWKPNSAATIAMLTRRLSGQKSKVRKGGGLNKAGLAALGNKKPLIGESGDLRRQIVAVAAGKTLTVISTPKYAAIQQFGGTTSAKSWIPGKAIPARPFLPIRPDRTLYPTEQATILDALNQYLTDGLA